MRQIGRLANIKLTNVSVNLANKGHRASRDTAHRLLLSIAVIDERPPTPSLLLSDSPKRARDWHIYLWHRPETSFDSLKTYFLAQLRAQDLLYSQQAKQDKKKTS